MNNPESTTRHKLVVAREFSAPRELVWKAWTEPQHIRQWLGSGGDMIVESVTMDLRVGGKFRLQQRMDDGEYYTAAGTYLEVNPINRLVYTWDWEKDGAGIEFGELEGNETQVTIEFSEIEGRTLVTLTHENFGSVKSRDNHQQGWQSWLAKLADFINDNQTTP